MSEALVEYLEIERTFYVVEYVPTAPQYKPRWSFGSAEVEHSILHTGLVLFDGFLICLVGALITSAGIVRAMLHVDGSVDLRRSG
jgi:hypothetical protein